MGRYSSLSVSSADGRPFIAYFAQVVQGSEQSTELRAAWAKVPQPTSVSDWDVFVLDAVALGPVPEEPPIDLPEGTGLFTATARLYDGSPVVAYYDRTNGDLKVVAWDAMAGAFSAPEVVDGADGSDVGWYPSMAVTSDDVVHLDYVDAGRDNLLYVNLADRKPVVVDDGFRIDGTTDEGLPQPVFHFVGDDSAIVSVGDVLSIVYQDATTHELLLSTPDANGYWQYRAIAGHADPFQGAYGFYASAEPGTQDVVVSTYVLDQANYDSWVEVFFAQITIE